MLRHLVGVIAATSLLAVCALLPFLPGKYDRFALQLSVMAQVFAFAGLLLVPVGVVWLAHELRKSRAIGDRPAAYRTARYARIALGLGVVVWAMIAIAAAAHAGLSLGVLTVVLGAYLFQAARALIRRLPTEHATLYPAPLYLTLVAPALALLLYFGAEPISHWSRERVIGESAAMRDAIERYHNEHGSYPLSLAAVHNDDAPSSLGVERFRYEPSGDAYNLYFEHHSLRFGTQEFVVFNPRDEQDFTSHDRDLLELGAADLQLQRGYYASHDSPTHHWKYYWFD